MGIRNLAEQSQEQATVAYQKFLKEFGFGSFSFEVVRHVICQLLQFECWVVEDLFSGLTNPSIDFFDQVYSILNFQNFKKLFLGAHNGEQIEKRSKTTKGYCAYLCAFVLVPKNDKEKSLRQKYLKQFELGSFDLPQSFNIRRSLLPDGVELNKKYAEASQYDLTSTDGKTYREEQVNLIVSQARSFASQERVFFELGTMADSFVLDGDDSAKPDWVSSKDVVKKSGRDLAPDLLGLTGSSLERLKSKITGRDKKLDEIEKKLVRCISVLLGLIEHIKKDELLDLQQLQNFVYKQAYFIGTFEKLPFLSDFVQRYAGMLSQDLIKFGKNGSPQAVELYLWKCLKDQFSYQDILQTVTEFETLNQRKDLNQPGHHLKGVAESTKGELAWYLYNKNGQPIDNSIDPSKSESKVLVPDKQEVLAYLDELGKQSPDAVALKEMILKFSGNVDVFLILATGHLSEFYKFFNDSIIVTSPTKRYGTNMKDVVVCLRLAEKIYGNDWKPLEQYRRFDEQLSVWEWNYNNPVLKDKIKVEFTDYHKYPSTKFNLDIPLVSYVQDIVNDSSLTSLYEMDKNYIEGPKFSWPLFLNDLWDGDDEFIKDIEDNTNSKKKITDEKIEALRLFKKRLVEMVENPNNLKEIFGMQPRFFKEFILNKKMEANGVQSLEEIEGYLEYFSAYTHEGSKRNQVPGLLESIRSEARKERKKSLYIKAVNELIDPEERKQIALDLVKRMEFENLNTLSDRDVQLYVDVLTSDEAEIVAKRMRELLIQEESTASSIVGIPESDLSLYSDHIIENNKSKLEIGPVYRLRWLAQPLMDWHVQALENAGSMEAVEALYGRVEKDLPEKHPLRDLYVKNQLTIKIWQILKKVLVDPEGSGFSLAKKDIDVEKSLKNFSLNTEKSFLKSYSIFEIDGLEKNIQKLPPKVIDAIIEAIEAVINEQISPDQHAALRRLLFSLEQKTKFDNLKQEGKGNPQVFDNYLERVLIYFPNPSLERDDILEQSVMELAQTPEQIRQVWSLRYQEQTRWANEDESFIEKTGFESAERARIGISMMSALDRAQYLLWTLGGKTPLSELFTAQETEVSLEERKNMLWKMTKTERRSLLYELLMGEEGVLQSKKRTVYSDHYTDSELKIVKAHDKNYRKESPNFKPEDFDEIPPRWDRPSDMVRYVVDNIFEQTFGDQDLDPSLSHEDKANKRGRELMQTVFHELFLQQKDPARRTELMINIVEAVGKNKYEGKSLTPGEMMKLLLEQVGVVGVKVGQVLSEQPGLLPENMQRELATLKDQAATFSKRGVLTYLEAAGWVNGDDPKITTIADCIGSASIKQVMEGKTKTGESVAIKVKRPSIDKNFAKDMELLQAVLGKVKEKGFDVPGYLINEVRDIVLEELSFTHEADNQLAMKKCLQERKASIPIEVGGVVQEISLSVSAPLSVLEVLYPIDENKEDIGLMVEEFVRGLSLKNLQEYQSALIQQDQPKIEKMRKRVGELYGQGRIEKVEKQIAGMNVDNLQAQLAIDLLRQITKDGVFHADLHGGNFYLDFNPSVKDGVFSEIRGVFIDLGSVGFSKSEAMPNYQKEIMGENFNAGTDFRDFITALFSIDMMPEDAKKKIAEMVSHYAGLDWNEDSVDKILSQSTETETRVKSLFYSILEQKGQGQLNPQFRALLKTLATAAGHFDKLKSVLLGENPESLGISPEEMDELINFEAIATA